jgi:hypothetical protein
MQEHSEVGVRILMMCFSKLKECIDRILMVIKKPGGNRALLWMG